MKSSKDTNKIKIYKRGILCGYLFRRNDGGAEFTYDESYLAESQTLDLCFNMKKRKEPYIQHGVNLHPYFAGLLPEGLRLKYLVQRVKTSSDDLFSLFASIGHDCVGDVYAHSGKAAITPDLKEIPKWNEINFYDFFLSTLAEDSDQSEFAGIQEKISASMISLHITAEKKGASILKLNPKDKENLVYNEWACLTQEDLCQALNLFPSEKYRVSLKDIVYAIQKYSTAPLIEVYNLLKQIIFSYLIGNGDMHAKNISLTESPTTGHIGLTPAYDLICTLIYGDTKMALKLDAKDSNLKRRDIIIFGLRFGLSRDAIESMMDDLLYNFNLNHHILFSIPMTDQKSNFLSNEIISRINALSID